jgi:hypothetical protein
MPPAANDNQAPPVLRMVRWTLAGLVLVASAWLLFGSATL